MGFGGLCPRRRALSSDDPRTSWSRARVRSATVDRGGRHVGPPFRPAGRRGSREAILRRARGGAVATMRDTQADVPSAIRLRAQLAFKDSMVHGILQFTPSIAFRYVLHRCESRDIRCRESFRIARGMSRRAALPLLCCVSLAPVAPGFGWRGRPRADGPSPSHAGGTISNRSAGRTFVASTMILPQVHLRKPCYDFSFL